MLVKHLFECCDIIVMNVQKIPCFAVQGKELFMYFYQRLRDVREDFDKKQEEIARVLKITRQQYQLYESGKRELPMHHFITLARYYGITLDFLAGLIDTPRKLG